jgi:two-component system response regulator HydG
MQCHSLIHPFQVCRKRRLHLQIHPFGDFVQHGIRNQNLFFPGLLLDPAGDIDRRPHHPLNVINIRISSLKERPDDIPLLAQHFLTRYAQKNRKLFKGFTPVAMDALMKHPWPSNVRELENAVERAVILSMGQYISEKDLPADVVKNYRPDEVFQNPLPELGGKSLDEVEAMALIQTLKQTGGNKTEAAKLLNITRTTLNNKIKKCHLDLDQILSSHP